jgi:hypothetical protein
MGGPVLVVKVLMHMSMSQVPSPLPTIIVSSYDFVASSYLILIMNIT